MATFSADELKRESYGEWAMHQTECQRGCRSSSRHGDRFCEEGRELLAFSRVAMHVAEFGTYLTSDNPQAVAAYLEEAGLSVEDLRSNGRWHGDPKALALPDGGADDSAS